MFFKDTTFLFPLTLVKPSSTKDFHYIHIQEYVECSPFNFISYFCTQVDFIIKNVNFCEDILQLPLHDFTLNIVILLSSDLRV